MRGKEHGETQAPDPYADAKAYLHFFLGGNWLPDHPRFIAMRLRLIKAESDADVNQKFIDAYDQGNMSNIEQGFTSRQKRSIRRHGFILAVTDDSQVTQELRKGSNIVYNQYLQTARSLIFPAIISIAENVDPYEYWINDLRAENEATKVFKKHMGPYIRFARVKKIIGLSNKNRFPV